MNKLKLEIDPNTTRPFEEGLGFVSFYESSISHPETGEPLLSVHSSGRGLRLTRNQAVELHAWLGEWITEMSTHHARGIKG